MMTEMTDGSKKCPYRPIPIACRFIGAPLVTSLFCPPPTGSTLITFTSPVYTGQTLTLTCGPPPPDLDIGVLSGRTWTLDTNPVQDGGRFLITTTTTNSGSISQLEISSLVSADRGEGPPSTQPWLCEHRPCVE